MTITTRQNKIKATLERHNERLAKLEAKLESTISEKEIAKFAKAFNEYNAASIERGFCEACTPERAIAMIRRNREIDVKRLKETIEDTLYKLEKAKEADKREEERNAKRQAKQNILTDIPEVLKAFG